MLTFYYKHKPISVQRTSCANVYRRRIGDRQSPEHYLADQFLDIPRRIQRDDEGYHKSSRPPKLLCLAKYCWTLEHQHYSSVAPGCEIRNGHQRPLDRQSHPRILHILRLHFTRLLRELGEMCPKSKREINDREIGKQNRIRRILKGN